MNEGTPKKISKHVLGAQMQLLEFALIAWLEDLLGRVPSEDEILAKGFHVNFAKTPLTVFKKDGKEFHVYYVWDKTHVLAYGFLNAADPTALSVVRLPESPWPPALFAYVEQYGAKKEDDHGDA